MLVHHIQPAQQPYGNDVANRNYLITYQRRQDQLMYHAQVSASLQAHGAVERVVALQKPSISGGRCSDPPSVRSFFAPAPLLWSEREKELEERLEDEGKVTDYRSVNGMPNTILHCCGRAHLSGELLGGPKKRHNCHICGRGFARAFNLKSHVQTHTRLRPKPHQCPHPTCKRGFSRLHDLERHREGIHSDGPLIEAKRQGIAPSIARKQSKMQRRSESGDLP
ncbi:hypothetical protein EHS25_001957 [Saitozyma podzolica]|uniref:C2H2-type domain-containing protein n=1 Tax=Saitozyma podzolica TaxID=1890683 RepID=A0A427YFM4_9TREE|nr:hypothetical protein EHS25_001957 [Saitozyma podzolica]